MTSKVYFTEKFDEDSIKNLLNKVLEEMPEKIKKDEKLAIKVHFGEDGNTRFVSPEYVKVIADELRKINDYNFLTDSNTLYKGHRLNTVDHVMLARKHGFGDIANIIISDGEQEIEINKKIFQKVKISSHIAEASTIVFVSHLKGHILFGFGGTLKNIGMGCASRAGKLEQHSKIKPNVEPQKCTACNKCIDNCPTHAISLVDGKAKINQDMCIGCAECISICPVEAVQIPWGGATNIEAMQRCAEYAYGVVQGKKCVYITFINNISKDCDCFKDTRIIGKDVGIIASLNPVAADRAAYDLVNKKHNEDIFLKETKVDGQSIMDYAQELGLGEKAYELIELK